MISRRLAQLSRDRQPGAAASRAWSAAGSTSTLLEPLLDEHGDRIIEVLEEAMRGGPDPRGRRARPLHLRARARARDALRAPEREPPRAPAPAHRRGARGRRRREPRRARLPLRTRAGRRKAVGYALAAAEQAAAALAYEEAAEHYRRADDGARRRGSRSAPPSCAPATRRRARRSPPRRELARERSDRDALAEAALGHRRPPRRGRRRSTPRHRAARGGAGALQTEDSLLGVQLRARLVDRLTSRADERALALSAEALDDGPAARRPARAAGRARVAATPRCCTSTTSTSGCGSARSCSRSPTRIGERELEALGHHWRIYDLLEAGAGRGRAPRAPRAWPRSPPSCASRSTATSPSAGRSCGRRWRAASATPSGSRARPSSSAAARRPATPRRSTPPRC